MFLKPAALISAASTAVIARGVSNIDSSFFLAVTVISSIANAPSCAFVLLTNPKDRTTAKANPAWNSFDLIVNMFTPIN